MRYPSKRHRDLMEESEQALSDATSSPSKRLSRIASQVLNDPKTHRLWESRHAELVRPVAEQDRRTPQVFALRNIEVQLIHRRALIDYIRRNRIPGKKRDRLFAAFYGPKDTINAILSEHAQYELAVSSRVSTHHLIGVMHDPVGIRLLSLYEKAYADYFDLYCYVAEDSFAADAVKLLMMHARQTAMRVRRRLSSERPDNHYADFDRQVQLARSGRYPILNYMVG
ncbi:MAG: hypothetical protein ACREQZ_15080 [Woeseiaceae bacterium]